MTRVALGLMLVAAVAHGDPLPAAVRAHAVRRTGPIAIDGKLDEPAWTTAPRQTGFVQRFPKDGVPADHETSFAVLYDDEALYVGVWAADPEPGRIKALLTRRDVDSPADSVTIGIDSYHDRRTAYVFQLNAAGVQRDMLLFDDQGQDDTWDAVWTGNAAIDEHGWTAEFRIPLDQLRFDGSESHEWGFQILRTVGRSAEQSTWSPWPRSTPAIVSRFGIVDGIEHLQQGRRLELLPYATGGVDVAPVDAGDPLNDHVSTRRNVGLDLKYGLGPAFTLSATINPDFGQVEADPSQVNLSPFELFFAEKRPFFLEGVDLFKLPIGNSDGTVETQFYSRRIGAVPLTPDGTYQYTELTTPTTIYGAAKLSGKTRDGWSIGVLDAVTGPESEGLIDDSGARTDPQVAALTNYAVGRVKRDFRDGKTSVGMSATAVDRSLDGTALAATTRDQAYTAGLQVQHRWDNDAWQINFHTVGSWIHGSEDAIAATQQDSNHFYQRPDATDVAFDPHRTSLSGLGATWLGGMLGDTKHWRFGFGGDLRTPGLELDDAGFQTGSDRVIPYLWGQYRVDEPSSRLLNWQFNSDVFTVSNFEPLLNFYGIEGNVNAQLTNYWNLGLGYNVQGSGWDQVALRGGAALRTNPNASLFAFVSTDSRKPVRIDLNANAYRDWTADAINGGISIGATIQARSNIDLYLGPSWYARVDPLQYVAEADDATGTPHYVFATIHQTTASMTTRVNWTFSPHLSLQVYAQPFIASGRYSQLKDVNNPHAAVFSDRFHVLQGTDYAIHDGTVFVDYGGMYSFDRPDFDIRQLRSTVVLRWEYRPGSTVFAIWNHGQTSTSDDGRFQPGHDLAGLLKANEENLVMIKANYWIGL